jgi:hypothetical protein
MPLTCSLVSGTKPHSSCFRRVCTILMKYTLLFPFHFAGDFTLTQIQSELERQGHKVSRLIVWRENRFATEKEVSADLELDNPDRILWVGNAGLMYYELLASKRWEEVTKICLFYDDPVMITAKCPFDPTQLLKDSSKRKDFVYGIWDGHWRKEAQRLWNIKAHACHLSADINDYKPSEENPLPNSNVFVGCLHSPKEINRRFDLLKHEYQLIVKEIDSVLTADGTRGRDEVKIPHAQKLLSIAGLTNDYGNGLSLSLFDTATREQMDHVRWITWVLAKNAARIKLLRRTPNLVMFSEMRQVGHANIDEIRAMLLDDQSKIPIYDTSDFSTSEIGKLCHYGKIQISITDPQSVEGGIPYRVFQTAAAGRPLLTDFTTELRQCFIPDKELYRYHGLTDYQMLLDIGFNDTKEVGAAGRERFLKEHTWAHRIADFDKWIANPHKAEAGSFEEICDGAMTDLKRRRETKDYKFKPELISK